MRVFFFIVAATIGWCSDALADVDLGTNFSQLGSIENTRHNLTFDPIGAGNVNMNQYRNDYQEICVYCHTPHGASDQLQIPLWNRTVSSATYTTYDTLKTPLSGTVTSPGANSLSCLSCHDGTVAVDSIINMPGSGRYSVAQKTAVDPGFLNTWDNAVGADASVHMTLVECLLCHDPGAGVVGTGATDFRIAVIGTDLTDDHPIGINYGANPDFNAPTGATATMSFFDDNGSGRPDSDEIRMYDTGDGPEVECASCHDPHGVPSAGAGSLLQPTFLRQDNEVSNVCLVCHIK